jgi:hypothetical protein
MIRVKRDGIDDYKGKKWRLFYYDLYTRSNERKGGGFVMINLNPPQHFEKKARCNRGFTGRSGYVARVNGAHVARVNGAYTARVTDDCR